MTLQQGRDGKVTAGELCAHVCTAKINENWRTSTFSEERTLLFYSEVPNLGPIFLWFFLLENLLSGPF